MQSQIDDITEEWSHYSVQPEISTASGVEGVVLNLPEEDSESTLCDTEVVYFMADEGTG